MPQDPDSQVDITPEQQKKLDWIVERFEAAWYRGENPRIDNYLPADPSLRHAVLVELAHIEIEFRRKAGEAIDGAAFSRRFPELLGDSVFAQSQATLRDPPRSEKPAASPKVSPPPGRRTITWMSTLPGTEIAGYTLREMIGVGGMGVVFKAEHRHMKRTVTVKMLRPSVLEVPELVKRFYREIEVMARLSHPNIVAALDAGEHRGDHYLVMEYVDGVDLARFKTHGILPVEQAVDWVLQVAAGLEYAHRRGIVHRDIKPGNLMLDKQGTIKILDLGLARFRRDVNATRLAQEASALTEIGNVIGTVDFMAPEQSLDARDADAASDMYSLGATFYYLLVGTPMYHGESLMLRVVAHRGAPIPSLCSARPDVPPQIDAIFSRMVAKKKGDRYPSMTSLIAELGRFRTSGNPSLPLTGDPGQS